MAVTVLQALDELIAFRTIEVLLSNANEGLASSQTIFGVVKVPLVVPLADFNAVFEHANHVILISKDEVVPHYVIAMFGDQKGI